MRVLVEVQKRVPPTSTTTRSTSRRIGAVVSSVAGDPDAARLRDIEHESAIRCVEARARRGDPRRRVLGAKFGQVLIKTERDKGTRAALRRLVITCYGVAAPSYA